ncbi:MAG TPA: putative porin [Pseudomonadales bacterium]|nr:putative porin [Pseudomonadales bacterium]
MRKTIASACGGLVLAALNSVALADSVDAKLLAMLKANGSITQAQYDELSADLAKQAAPAPAAAPTDASAASKKDLDDFEKKVAWAAKTVVSGDVRARQETIDVQNLDPEQQANRQRVRARVGFVSQVTDEVEAGVRIASGNNNDARSTNQDLNNYFVKKDLWLDRAYVNWHPTDVPGLKIIAGKMAQPWVSEDQLIWDDDINPEGLAAQYSHKVEGVELFGSTGAFTLQNNVNGNGNQFTDDLRLISAQFGARFTIADNYKVTLGTSLYHYHLDGDSPLVPPSPAGTLRLSANGNTTSQFQLYEGFGQLDIGGLKVADMPLPLSFYGQYVKNPNANGPQDDEDMGWLLGVKTTIWRFGLNYNYRNVQRNAVVGAFFDSDFANGFVGSRGSKYQLSYPIAKNFTFWTTYYRAESNTASTQSGSDVDTWQIDVVASF